MRDLCLNLDGTGISDWGVINSLPYLLKPHIRLKRLRLHLARGDICTRKGLHSLVGAIVSLHNLQHLDLRLVNCNLPDSGVFRHLRVLTHLVSIHLDLSLNRAVGRRTLHGLLRLLQQNRDHLRVLTLCFQGTNIPEWYDGVKLDHLMLVSLNLQLSCRCSTGVPFILRSCAPSALKHLVLDFSCTVLGDRGCQRLGYMLLQFGAIQTLEIRLSGNEVQDVGLNTLLLAFMNMPCLSELFICLEDNRISSAGLNLFAHLFQLSLKVLFVNLSDNALGFAGMQTMCQYVSCPPSSPGSSMQLLLCGCHPLSAEEREFLLGELPTGVCM